MPVSAAPNAIVLTSDVKSYLKITDASNDDFIQTLINRTSDSVEKFLRTCVVQKSFVGEIHDGGSGGVGIGARTIYPFNFPVRSLVNFSTNPTDQNYCYDGNGFVKDIAYRTTPVTPWITFVPNIGYVFIKPSHPYYIQLWAWAFPYGEQNIQISYIAGWQATGGDLTTVPGDITQVVVEHIADIINESNVTGQGRLGRKSTAVSNPGAGSATESFQDISERHKVILKGYRRPIAAVYE